MCKGDACCFNHTTPSLFVNSQWRIPQSIYLIYRIIVSLLFIAVAVLDYIWYNNDSVKWFIYLTNWMFVVMTSDVSLQMALVTESIIRSKRGTCYTEMPCSYKIMWFLYNVASGTGLVITLFYWSILYPFQTENIHFGGIFKHAINSVYIISNLCITGIPIRLLHFWQPLTCGAGYIIFSITYDFSGGTNEEGKGYVYPPLDWNRAPVIAVLYAMSALLVTVLMWGCLYGLYRLRRAVVLHWDCGHESYKVID